MRLAATPSWGPQHHDHPFRCRGHPSRLPVRHAERRSRARLGVQPQRAPPLDPHRSDVSRRRRRLAAKSRHEGVRCPEPARARHEFQEVRALRPDPPARGQRRERVQPSRHRPAGRSIHLHPSLPRRTVIIAGDAHCPLPARLVRRLHGSRIPFARVRPSTRGSTTPSRGCGIGRPRVAVAGRSSRPASHPSPWGRMGGGSPIGIPLVVVGGRRARPPRIRHARRPRPCPCRPCGRLEASCRSRACCCPRPWRA